MRVTLCIVCCVVLFAPVGGCDASEKPSRRSHLPDWVTDAVLDSVAVGIERSRLGGEVPIGAVCIVGTEQGRRLFVGSNSMQTHVTGHAEIAALDAALEHLRPGRLDPDSTWLLTSFEPCPMCVATLADIHRIPGDHVAVLMQKIPEWRDAEYERVRRFRESMIMTGQDDLQLRAFCEDDRFRSEYPELCE